MSSNSWKPGEQNKAKFDEIYGQHKERIYTYILYIVHNKQDAKDLTAETFTRFWRKMGKVEREAQIKPLLFIIARNLSIDRLRALVRSGEANRAFSHAASEAAATPADILENKQERIEKEAIIKEEMRKLPEKWRKVLRLLYIERKSEAVIARMMRIKPTYVSVLKSRAIQRIREALEKKFKNK